MAAQRESGLQRRIRKAIKAEFKCWLFKVHGGPFQQSGIPDIVGVVAGLFFALEVKTDTGAASVLQLETIADIRKAGGIAKVVRTPEEAVATLAAHLRRAGQFSEARRSVVDATSKRRTVLRARNRKDVDHRRRHRRDVG